VTDRRFFRIAAAWNLLAAGGAMLQPALVYRMDYGYDGPIEGIWLQLHYGFWLCVAVFGVGYALVAADPTKNRGIVVMGVVGKTAIALYWTAQFLLWRGTIVLLAGALGDLAFAGLFLRWLRRPA
jgi:hypothetical protein